jgi:hypothetical protein
MSVEFNDEQVPVVSQYRSRRLLGEYDTPPLMKLLMKTGIAKTEKQAYYTMVIIMLCSFVAAGLILYSQFKPRPAANAPTTEQMQLMMQNSMTSPAQEEEPVQ